MRSKTPPSPLRDPTQKTENLRKSGDLLPVPPIPIDPDAPTDAASDPDDPTRYGDWQVRGRCIDF